MQSGPVTFLYRFLDRVQLFLITFMQLWTLLNTRKTRYEHTKSCSDWSFDEVSYSKSIKITVAVKFLEIMANPPSGPIILQNN